MSKKELWFTNSAGERFALSPLNPLEEDMIRQQVEREWLESGKAIPEPPSYEVTTVTGETQRIQLASAADADTDELKRAWLDYEAASTELQGAFMKRYMASCYLCVQANPDDYPMWRRRMKFLQTPIPADPDDAFYLFCTTWVIRSTEDITGLIVACTRTIANVSEEKAAAAEAMFRRALEEAANTGANSKGA